MSSFKKSVAENLFIEIDNAVRMANWVYDSGEEQADRFAYWIQRKYLFVDFAIKQFNMSIPEEVPALVRAEMVMERLKLVTGD